MKTIPQRELRNRVSKVLHDVEAGERMRITVDGRPVADLVPVEGTRRTFVHRDVVKVLLHRASLDRKFARDLSAIDSTSWIIEAAMGEGPRRRKQSIATSRVRGPR